MATKLEDWLSSHLTVDCGKNGQRKRHLSHVVDLSALPRKRAAAETHRAIVLLSIHVRVEGKGFAWWITPLIFGGPSVAFYR